MCFLATLDDWTARKPFYFLYHFQFSIAELNFLKIWKVVESESSKARSSKSVFNSQLFILLTMNWLLVQLLLHFNSSYLFNKYFFIPIQEYPLFPGFQQSVKAKERLPIKCQTVSTSQFSSVPNCCVFYSCEYNRFM